MDTDLVVDLQLAEIPTDGFVEVDPWSRRVDCRLDELLEAPNGSVMRWSGEQRQTRVRSTAALTVRFARLWRQPDSQIVAFGRRYGPLWICRSHDLPMTHLAEQTVSWMLSDLAPLLPGFERDDVIEDHQLASHPPAVWTEPVAAWRHWSQGAELLLRFAAATHRNESPTEKMWAQLGEWEEEHVRDLRFRLQPVPMYRGRRRDDARPPASRNDRVTTTRLAQQWLQWGGVRLGLRWDDEHQPRLVFETESLFGAIAADLARAVLGNATIEFCHHCGKAFQRTGENDRGNPRRRTQAGKHSYCDEPQCRRAISRDSKRKRRAQRARST